MGDSMRDQRIYGQEPDTQEHIQPTRTWVDNLVMVLLIVGVLALAALCGLATTLINHG